MASARHAMWRPTAEGNWTGAFASLRLHWPGAACLVVFLLVAAPGKGHATLLEGGYNISGSCTAAECFGGPLSFSGMFDIDSSGLVQNFMMSFDGPGGIAYMDIGLLTTTAGGTMFEGPVFDGALGVIEFSDDDSWQCTSGSGCPFARPQQIMATGDFGTYRVEPKQVSEPPTAALFAFGLILIVWLARRCRAGSSAVRSARWACEGT